MKERSILFNGEMVRAILEGRKTQTRRVVKPQPLWVYDNKVPVKTEDADPKGAIKCPYGQPGDRLWVRETFMGPLIDEDGDYSNGYHSPEFCEYRADGGPAPEWVDMDGENHQGWKPSIHMPRWASRILLEITAVRVERLQEISDVDAEAEGAKFELAEVDSVRLGAEASHRSGFQNLWQSISGPDSWAANPWVWVVEFRRVEP